MIEKIFTRNSIQKPLVLNNCTLFSRLEYYDIGNTYIFSNQATYKVAECGSGFIKDYLKTEIFNKGYFTAPAYQDLVFGEKFNNSDEVAIIGYSQGVRYIIQGVSIGNTRIFPGFVAKFSFLGYKQI